MELNTQTQAASQITEMMTVLQAQRNSALDALVNTTVKYNLAQAQTEITKQEFEEKLAGLNEANAQLVGQLNAYKQKCAQLEHACAELKVANEELNQKYEAHLANQPKSRKRAAQ